MSKSNDRAEQDLKGLLGIESTSKEDNTKEQENQIKRLIGMKEPSRDDVLKDMLGMNTQHSKEEEISDGVKLMNLIGVKQENHTIDPDVPRSLSEPVLHSNTEEVTDYYYF